MGKEARESVGLALVSGVFVAAVVGTTVLAWTLEGITRAINGAWELHQFQQQPPPREDLS